MQLTITPSLLADLLGQVAPACNASGTLPVYGHVALHADGSSHELTLRCFDSRTEITAVAAAHVIQSGQCTVSHSDLTALIKRLSKRKNDLRLQISGPQLQLSCGAFSADLTTGDYTDLPSLDTDNGGQFRAPVSVTMPAKQLAQDLDAVLYAAALKDVRFYLCGVHIEHANGAMIYVCTDGHRMATLQRQMPADGWPPIIIPQQTAAAMVSLCNSAAVADIELINEHTSIGLRVGSVTLRSSLIDGRFPEWRRVLPRDAAIGEIDHLDLIGAVELVMTSAHKKTHQINFEMEGDSRLKIWAMGENKAATETIETNINWPKIAFCGTYVISALSKMTAPVSVYAFDGVSSIRLDSTLNGADYQAVIMPMRA